MFTRYASFFSKILLLTNDKFQTAIEKLVLFANYVANFGHQRKERALKTIFYPSNVHLSEMNILISTDVQLVLLLAGLHYYIIAVFKRMHEIFFLSLLPMPSYMGKFLN